MGHITLDLIKIHKPRIRNDAQVIQLTLEVESDDLYTVNIPIHDAGNVAGQLMNLFMTASATNAVRAQNNETSSDTRFTTIPDVHHIAQARVNAHDDGSMDIEATTVEYKDLLVVFPDGMLQGIVRAIYPVCANPPPPSESPGSVN